MRKMQSTIRLTGFAVPSEDPASTFPPRAPGGKALDVYRDGDLQRMKSCF